MDKKMVLMEQFAEKTRLKVEIKKNLAGLWHLRLSCLEIRWGIKGMPEVPSGQRLSASR